MNVLITGGTGFVGSHLVLYLLGKGCNITIITRDKSKVASGIKAIEDINEIKPSEQIDVIVNLAGAPISKRWSEKYKQELIASRINSTKDIISLIKKLKQKPDVLISASAIGYYGLQDDTPLNEEAHPRNEFTHQLCKKWENEALKAEKLGVRVCITRLGVVLGKNGGALKQMLPPFKMGLGGKIGSGKQYFSWAHIDDVISALSFLVENKNQSGIYNLTAPNPVTNAEFTKALGRQLKRPTLFPMPAFIVKLLFGEMGETLLLKGQRVVPNKLKKTGFKFKYPKINEALGSIVK
jgi:uncharacterized protein